MVVGLPGARGEGPWRFRSGEQFWEGGGAGGDRVAWWR